MFKEKLRKIFDLPSGVWLIENNNSFYFLSASKYKSLETLRSATSYEKKTPKLFYDIIHKDFLEKTKSSKSCSKRLKKLYENRKKEKEKKIHKANKLINNIGIELSFNKDGSLHARWLK